MARPPRQTVGSVESREDAIGVTLNRPEASSLASVAEIGLDADEALSRIQNTATAERALKELRASRSPLVLRRPEAAALAAVAEAALALARSPRGRFQTLFDGLDLAAARRGLDELRGAMR